MAEAEANIGYENLDSSAQELIAALLAMGHDPLSKKNSTGVDYVDLQHHDTYDFIDPKQFDLKDRTVFITGASKGIGKAAAIGYAKAGVSSIGIGARSPLDAVEKEIQEAAKKAGRPAPKILALKLDVTKKENVAQAAKEMEETFGHIDVLVNNSGYMETQRPIVDADPDEWWQAFQVNIFGTFLMSRAFMPLLLKNDNSLKTIVNVGSLWGHTKFANGSAYITSKHALMRFSEVCNSEYGAQGLLCHNYHPGGVDTELASALPDVVKQFLVDKPELAADALVWMTAERRDWLAGRYISAQWDMKELLDKKEKIVQEDHLKMRMAVGRD